MRFYKNKTSRSSIRPSFFVNTSNRNKREKTCRSLVFTCKQKSKTYFRRTSLIEKLKKPDKEELIREKNLSLISERKAYKSFVFVLNLFLSSKKKIQMWLDVRKLSIDWNNEQIQQKIQKKQIEDFLVVQVKNFSLYEKLKFVSR